MPNEIERKFLVADPSIVDGVPGVTYRQGYLSTVPERTVRVRVAGDHGYITVKGRAAGQTRPEFEYEIPLDHANEMLSLLCEQPLIEKRRHRIGYSGHIWEVDVFDGENAGLVVAEVELESEGEAVELPQWVGTEVTDDPRYLNANLVARPFRRW